jgi:hypothetical protein
MKTLLGLIGLVTLCACGGVNNTPPVNDPLVKEFGTSYSPAGRTKLTVSSVDANHIAFVIERSKGSPSFGPRDPVPVVAERWALFHDGEDKVWFFDGRDQVSLYEFTKDDRFTDGWATKTSDSTLVPALRATAAEPLRNLMTGH